MKGNNEVKNESTQSQAADNAKKPVSKNVALRSPIAALMANSGILTLFPLEVIQTRLQGKAFIHIK